MKILKSKKGLSPVVASIILIAVTVAVSIAVAAWMGALTFTFMRTEEYNIISVNFSGTSGLSNNSIVIKIQNTGSSSFTIDTPAKVNGVTKTLAAQVKIEAGTSTDVTIPNIGWVDGQQYNMELITTQGTKFPYIANAPQT